MGLLLLFYVKNAIAHVALSPLQNLMAFVYILTFCITETGYFALTGLFLFTSWNVAIGLTACIVLMSVNMAFMSIQLYMHIPIHDYWVDGLTVAAYNDMMVGKFPWKLIVMIAVYIVGVVAATIAIFERKELDL